MKAYVILTQKQYSKTLTFIDKKGKETEVKGDRLSIKQMGLIEKIASSPSTKYPTVYFTKKDAVMDILDPSITNSILNSFQSAKETKAIPQYKLKAFFLIKAINIAINTKRKVYSCQIDEKEIITDKGKKVVRNIFAIKQEQITQLQMKSVFTKAVPGAQNILNDMYRMKQETVENLPKESKEIVNKLKHGLIEIPMSKINAVDIIIETINLEKEIEQNEQTNSN